MASAHATYEYAPKLSSAPQLWSATLTRRAAVKPTSSSGARAASSALLAGWSAVPKEDRAPFMKAAAAIKASYHTEYPDRRPAAWTPKVAPPRTPKAPPTGTPKAPPPETPSDDDQFAQLVLGANADISVAAGLSRSYAKRTWPTKAGGHKRAGSGIWISGIHKRSGALLPLSRAPLSRSAASAAKL